MAHYIDTPKQIHNFRYVTLLKGLELELKGLRMNRGRTAYSIIKKEFGFKGNKERVHKQLKEWLEAQGILKV